MIHVVHMCACGACMYIYAYMFLVVHVVHICAYGACMCIYFIYAHMCVWWYMYVYMVHIYAPLIGHAYMCRAIVRALGAEIINRTKIDFET